MKMFNTSFSLFTVAVLFQANLVLSNENSRIVNGAYVPSGQIPYQVSLQQDGAHNCGGSILNENFVLTAAHCVSSATPKQLQVIAGTVDLNNRKAPASTHKVLNILMHEDYQESNNWKNDIALLQVSPPFEFNQNISPAKLPSSGSKIKDGATAVVSGFGRVGRNSPTSTRLLKADVYTVSQAYCQRFFGGGARSTNICTNNLFKVTGFCNGDSGGPLTLDGEVVGIVSYGSNFGCADSNQIPQVYTRVSKYIDWICDHINEEN